MKPIATYVISNNMALQIFDINENEEEVLVGSTDKDAEWCAIHNTQNHEDTEETDTPYFLWGKMVIPINECVRVNK